MAKKKKSKRGPGRPPGKAKQAKRSHDVPAGFWPQVGAILLMVLGLLLLIGLFRIGGAFPINIAEGARWLVGWTAFIIPFLFLWQAIQIFRSEDNRLPGIVWFATILFLTFFAGLFQLMITDPLSQTEALAGQGGGAIGWLVASVLLDFASTGVAALILAVLILVLSLFVLAVSPKSVFSAIANFFRSSEKEINTKNEKVIREAASDGGAKTVGEVKITGMPTIDEDAKSKKSKVRSAKNDEDSDKTAAPPTALTARPDENWEAPSLNLLDKKQRPPDPGDVDSNLRIIKDTLADFGIEVEMTGVNVGPRVSQYTLLPQRGLKMNKITALEANLALSLAAQALRIEAPIPGKSAVGIEVPNAKSAIVSLRGILESDEWKKSNDALTFAIGRDIAGRPVIGSLGDKMPHLLIAGQPGSGKSVLLDTMLSSLLFRNSPDNLRLILIDPKGTELNHYDDIPHLLTPVIKNTDEEPLREAVSALKWATAEMERRNARMAEQRDSEGRAIKKIAEYNAAFPDDAMPYILVVIDELRDLFDAASDISRNLETDIVRTIQRLTQRARSAGIHLVLSTQRPDVKSIPGTIKASTPARIAFKVASPVDSQTIINKAGAEKLLGQGDMLIVTDSGYQKRVQGAFVSGKEVSTLANFLRLQRPVEYNAEIIAQPIQISTKGGVVFSNGSDDDLDPMYDEIMNFVISQGEASTSAIGRHYRLGYNRSARIIDQMEARGIVGPKNGSKAREVLVSSVDEVGE